MQGARLVPQVGIAGPSDQLTMWISVDSRPSDHIGPHSLASTVRMPFNRTMNTAVMPLGNIQTPFAQRDTAQSPSIRRTTLEPQRFYVPHQQEPARAASRSGAGVRWAPVAPAHEALADPAPERERVTVAGRNVITCSSASGGIGTTLTAAILAQQLAKRHASTALVDADLRVAGGGLDVVLGLEHERGVRWHDVHAPLGQLNGPALQRKLPKWKGVAVLSHNPWQGEAPDWWEVQAAVQALAQEDDAVVVDAGRGEMIEQVATLVEASHMVFVELSVLGLARAQMHIEWLEQVGLNSVEQRNTPPGIGQEVRPMAAVPGQIVAVVGVEPRGTVRERGMVTPDEATSYLGRDVIGTLRADGHLCGDVLEGLGVRAVPRRNRPVIDELTSIAEHACALDGRRD